MKKYSLLPIFLIAAVGFCVAQSNNSNGENSQGIITISNIPSKYINGSVLISGRNAQGDGFFYHADMPEVCEGKVSFNVTGNDQTAPFAGSGVYTLSVTFFAPGGHTESATASFDQKITNGCANIKW
jgi:hypothetical protein